MQIVTIVGARPQFIKAATVSRAIEAHNQICIPEKRVSEILVHTGQHYDARMSGIFFDDLELPRPDYCLGVGSDSHGRQTGKMLHEIEAVLEKDTPDLVLVYGDTNSTLAGALAASKMHIPSAHIEAGLRSFNRKMPEEINRILVDNISNILFCPTCTAVENLEKEGLADPGKNSTPFHVNSPRRVFQVGDVMYDSVLYNSGLSDRKSDICNRLKLENEKYILTTVHRAENTDNPDRLRNIVFTLDRIARDGNTVVMPLHPRTEKVLKAESLTGLFDFRKENIPGPGLYAIDPAGYLDMIQLEKKSEMIITDSGGVQKEALILSKPCITLRNNTEWLETLTNDRNILTGADPEKIFAAYENHTNNMAVFPEDFKNTIYGNGNAAENIIHILSDVIR